MASRTCTQLFFDGQGQPINMATFSAAMQPNPAIQSLSKRGFPALTPSAFDAR